MYTISELKKVKVTQMGTYPLEDLRACSLYKLAAAFDNGKPNLDEVIKCFGPFYYDRLKTGTAKFMGWFFDFRPVLKNYVVKDKYSGWHEVWATNKTHVRQTAMQKSAILKIIEVV